MKEPIHIVLVEPEIPQNTGNIGRTCLGIGATLHLVGKLGFSLDEKELKRAGLDYWANVNLRIHPTWDQFLSEIPPGVDLNFFSTHGKVSFWDKKISTPTYLIFGSESRGFPKSFYETYRDRLVRIPVEGSIRSLNLSTAVGIAAFEAVRQLSVSSPRLTVGRSGGA